MSRYRGSKNKLARREGMDLGLKTVGSSAHASLLRRIKILPGQHGQKGRRKTSDYGVQLREKQKVRRMYGLNERQFRKYFKIASLEPRNTGVALMILLERRLDNVLYRSNLVPTRNFARQIITHGHVIIDTKKVDIPSYLVKTGMVIGFKDKIMKNPVVKKLLEDKKSNPSTWLQRKGPAIKITRYPKREDIIEDINEQLIIEFYSRQ
jgi:small subunit ribosomal protein S4